MDVENEKYNRLLAGVSFPPSSCAPRVSPAPKTPFPFPFKRLPRRLGEYVKSLRERHTLKHSEERHPKVGEVLLIKSEDKNRGKWGIGVVTDLVKGRDGVVRAAKLRVGTSCIERAVQQLLPLELCCDRVRGEVDKLTPLRVEAPEFRPSRDTLVTANLQIRNLAEENCDP